MSATSSVITIRHRGLPRVWLYAILVIVLAAAVAVGALSWSRSGSTSTFTPGTTDVPSGPASGQVVQNQAPSGSSAHAHLRQIAP